MYQTQPVGNTNIGAMSAIEVKALCYEYMKDIQTATENLKKIEPIIPQMERRDATNRNAFMEEQRKKEVDNKALTTIKKQRQGDKRVETKKRKEKERKEELRLIEIGKKHDRSGKKK